MIVEPFFEALRVTNMLVQAKDWLKNAVIANIKILNLSFFIAFKSLISAKIRIKKIKQRIKKLFLCFIKLFLCFIYLILSESLTSFSSFLIALCAKINNSTCAIGK